MFYNTNAGYELMANIATPNDRVAFMEKLAGIGYWELDVANRKIYCSDQIYHILGADEQIWKSLNLKDLMTPEEYQSFFKAIRRLYHHKTKISREIKLLSLNGTIKYCQLRADFFYIRQFVVIAGTIQDLSDLIETKKNLLEARNHAEKLCKDKSYFLAQASHDLRQPMQALCLYLDLFSSKNLNRTQLNIWEKINLTAQSLKNLLDNFLDLSKLEYGGTKPVCSWFNLGMLLSDLGREFTGIAECKNIMFEYTICNCRIYSDAFLVERILRNLLSNAFKFTKRKVSVKCMEKLEAVMIVVADDGIGISPDEQKHIFDEFYRGKNTADINNDGAGLGLAIVKKISLLLEAKITLKSKPGRGSTFSLTLKKR